MVAGTVMPLGELRMIYELLFHDGVMVANKDKRPQSKHPEIQGVTNLQVIKAMGSLKSRGYVRETFAWRHFYWYLTNEGIVYVRDYLRLPPEIVPSSLQRLRRPASTLNAIHKTAHVQTVEGPVSCPYKPATKASAERQESLMDRQGYRQRKKITLEEEAQTNRMPRFRGSVKSTDPFTSWASWEQESNSLKSGQGYNEEMKITMEIQSKGTSQLFSDMKRKHTIQCISEERMTSTKDPKVDPNMIPTKPVQLSTAAFGMTEAIKEKPKKVSVQVAINQETIQPSSETIANKQFFTAVVKSKVQMMQESPVPAETNIATKLPLLPLADFVPGEESEDTLKPSTADVTQGSCESVKRVTIKSKPTEMAADRTEVSIATEVAHDEAQVLEGKPVLYSEEPLTPAVSATEVEPEGLVLNKLVEDVKETSEMGSEDLPNQTLEIIGAIPTASTACAAIQTEVLHSTDFIGITQETCEVEVTHEATEPSQDNITQVVHPTAAVEETANGREKEELDTGSEAALTLEAVMEREHISELQVTQKTPELFSENVSGKPATSGGAEVECMAEPKVPIYDPYDQEEHEKASKMKECPSHVVGQITPDLFLEAMALVQTDNDRAEAFTPPLMVLPLEAQTKVTLKSLSDLAVMNKGELLVEGVLESKHTSPLIITPIPAVGVQSKVMVDHQKLATGDVKGALALDSEVLGEDPLAALHCSIPQEDWTFQSDKSEDDDEGRTEGLKTFPLLVLL